MGRIKPNPSTELAIIRLPVDMKEKAGKYAYTWELDEDTILVRFSENKEVGGLPSVYFSRYHMSGGDVEERFRRLESTVEELKAAMWKNAVNISNNSIYKEGPDRDSNPAPGIHSPRG